jgi:sulfide:quinone oxidoreductase
MNQPTAEEMQKVAESLGLKFVHQPVIGNAISQKDVDDFKSYYENAEKPIFAYCRTGTRSTMLWALSELSKRESSEIINLTSAAGYDLSHLIK